MANNRGKQFEATFKQDWNKTFPDGSIDRLYDTQGGMAGVRNICDFICYNYPNIFYLECKSHEGASFPFSCLSQYDKLVHKVGIPGVRVGVVLWLIDKDRVIYLPISTVTKLKESDYKSFNPEKIDKTEYFYVDIPATKKRVFMDCDYSVLTELEEGY